MTAFGGPAAHLAFMRSEFVVRRGWVSEQELVDLIGGASLLPGPTSTEVAMMLARRRRGWPALLVGGACFIAPSMVLVLGLSWAYVRYGTTEAGAGLLFGIKPVVVAIILNALVGLARTAVKELAARRHCRWCPRGVPRRREPAVRPCRRGGARGALAEPPPPPAGLVGPPASAGLVVGSALHLSRHLPTAPPRSCQSAALRPSSRSS